MEQQALTLGRAVGAFFMSAAILLGVVIVIGLPGFVYFVLFEDGLTWRPLAISAIWGTLIVIVTLAILGFGL